MATPIFLSYHSYAPHKILSWKCTLCFVLDICVLLSFVDTYYDHCFKFSMSTACMLDLGKLRPEYELCMDCRLHAAEGIFHRCHSDGHQPVTVLYVDEEQREIVRVPLPRRIFTTSKFRAHLPSECRNPQNCSFPHHQLAAKIMNQWREGTVAVSKPPTLVSHA